MIDVLPAGSPLERALSPALAPLASDATLVLDPASLARAIATGAPRPVAYVAHLDPAWGDVLPGTDGVLVAHAALLEGAIALGARRAATRAAAIVASSAPIDRAAARAELALPADARLVVVPAGAIGDDLTTFLVQLSLAAEGIRFLFDAGRDPAAARVLRERVPFPAHLFADGAVSDRAWAAADRALVRLDDSSLPRALASGAAPILAPPPAPHAPIARALARDHLAVVAASDVTLAIAIDEACSPAGLERARAAIAALDVATGASRVAEALRALLEDLARGGGDGLPSGLEPIGPAIAPPPPRGPVAIGPTPDDDIEKELAALRERIRSG